jgi:predicted PurR-regulated permease PerM
LVIVLFIGVYAAVEPSIYRRGFLVLIPPQHRDRTGKVISEVVDTLRWWLIGKFISMTIIGVLTTVGLWIMGIPLALALGIIAAIFTFIPNIGPLLSAIPAVLLGLIDSPQQALYIAALYVGIQTVESYMITPLIQRKTVSLPPALTLSAQVLLGVIFGGLGVALATPMTAAALVLSRMLYVDDTGVFKGTGYFSYATSNGTWVGPSP